VRKQRGILSETIGGGMQAGQDFWVRVLELSERVFETYLPGIFIFGGILLLLSPSQLALIAWEGVMSQQRVWVGGAFSFSAALYLGKLAKWFGSLLLNKWDSRISFADMRKRLDKTTPHERAVLMSFLHRNSRTMEFAPLDYGVVSLLRDRLISRAFDLSYYRGKDLGVTEVAHTIDEGVWEYLKQHPEVANKDALGNPLPLDDHLKDLR
jgi:superinfection exclusion protein B